MLQLTAAVRAGFRRGPLDIHVLVRSPGTDSIFTCCFAARTLGFRLLAAAWSHPVWADPGTILQEDPRSRRAFKISARVLARPGQGTRLPSDHGRFDHRLDNCIRHHRPQLRRN
jgi:hypothetical protein